MYKILNDLAPQNLNDFKYVSDVQSRVTRSYSSNMFYLPSHRTTIFRRSFTYHGPKVWNILPDNIRNSPSLFSFKKSAKNYFLCDN